MGLIMILSIEDELVVNVNQVFDNDDIMIIDHNDKLNKRFDSTIGKLRL